MKNLQEGRCCHLIAGRPRRRRCRRRLRRRRWRRRAGRGRELPGRRLRQPVQVPVHVPVNVGGNTVNVIGLLNPAFGNIGLNG